MKFWQEIHYMFFPLLFLFKFEVYGNLCIERPLGIDSGQPLPICISEHIGKGQFRRKGRSGTHCYFCRTGGWRRFWNRQQISQQLLGNGSQIACLGAAGCCSDREQWDVSCDSGNFLSSPKAAEACSGPYSSSNFFQCLLPCSTSALPKVTSCLL